MVTIEMQQEIELEVQETNSTITIKDSEINIITNWSCPVCDGDEETGCLMSDPQNCPYGRGI